MLDDVSDVNLFGNKNKVKYSENTEVTSNFDNVENASNCVVTGNNNTICNSSFITMHGNNLVSKPAFQKRKSSRHRLV